MDGLFVCIDHVGLAVPDLDEAIKLEPRNAQYRQVREQLASTTKPSNNSKP